MLHGLIHDELTPNVGIEIVKKFAFAAVHLVFFVAVLAIAGYWGIRIFTPSPLAAPPPLPPPPLRDPDPMAAARMFGKVDVVQSVASNVQAVGIFAAGKDSSAVLDRRRQASARVCGRTGSRTRYEAGVGDVGDRRS